ncbi:MAG: type II toxin-antitoxin system RelE/ParE family toxin [Clostridia bacterium]|nr:type II toxin-antitoxin system RelE/ParE family toxin [Clostridia bacterium]
MEIRYHEEAVKDLDQIEQYICGTLLNPVAARRVVQNILRDVMRLADMPYLGVAFSQKTGYMIDARVLVSGRYWIVYTVSQEIVILKIWDSRMELKNLLLNFPMN